MSAVAASPSSRHAQPTNKTQETAVLGKTDTSCVCSSRLLVLVLDVPTRVPMTATVLHTDLESFNKARRSHVRVREELVEPSALLDDGQVI